MQKTMTVREFEDAFSSRVKAYAVLFARKWGLSRVLTDDLYQACWIGICESLPYWKASDGSKAHKSAFNWCAGPMRKQMERVIRSHFGLKPVSKGIIKDLRADLDSTNEPASKPDLDSYIDLKNALENDPKPAHVARFVLTVVNPHERELVARSVRLTRQAVGMSVRKTRERLRLALG